MQTLVLNTKGEPAGKIDLPEEIFAVKASPQLLAQAVRVYLANQRHAQAKAKTRGEVKGSGKKIWRQKGTGRARHGDAYAPIFVGGGVAHGPTGRENHKLKLSKRQKSQTLFAALTQKIEEKELVIVSGLEEIKPKTKEAVRVIAKLTGNAKKTSVIVPENAPGLIRGLRNIGNISLLGVKTLNAYDVINAGTLVISKQTLGAIIVPQAKTKQTGLKQSRIKPERRTTAQKKKPTTGTQRKTRTESRKKSTRPAKRKEKAR